MVLTFILIVMWIEIIANEKITIDENGKSPEVFGILYEITSYLAQYATLCSINTIIRGLSLTQYFAFSSKLSMFSEIMRAAAFDIIFFAVMF